jgi:hypothetical protein
MHQTPIITTTQAKHHFLLQIQPKMRNSLEYLQDSITQIQKKYETLSNIVTKYNGKVHG